MTHHLAKFLPQFLPTQRKMSLAASASWWETAGVLSVDHSKLLRGNGSEGKAGQDSRDSSGRSCL